MTAQVIAAGLKKSTAITLFANAMKTGKTISTYSDIRREPPFYCGHSRWSLLKYLFIIKNTE